MALQGGASDRATPVDEEKADPDKLRSPPQARTILDVKDRMPAAFRPFITFEFEPSRSRSLRKTGIRQGRRTSRASVAITHFDPEGVEHLRSRFSLASVSSSPEGVDLRDEVGLKESISVHPASLEISAECQRGKGDLKLEHSPSSSVYSSSMIRHDLLAGQRLLHFDLETALRETIKQRGMTDNSPRTLSLAFKDLSVFGFDRSVSSQTVYQPTLWSALNPLEWTKWLIRMRSRHTRRIISGFEGVVNPGEMLLVLGRPDSGCNTLLKILANQTGGFVHVLGDRRYGSVTPRDMNRPRGAHVNYYPGGDAHVPSLTVQQIISFAAKMQRHNCNQALHDPEQLTTTLMTIFGLRHVKDALLGGLESRGISPAERSRASVCEAVAAGAQLCCWDNRSHELDVSATLDFVRALRIGTDLSAMTTIVSLSQAGEPLYQLFDKVCVVGEGRMYYYGRADAARDYFVDIGYVPYQRQATADFLISVTDPLGRMKNPNRPFSTPRTAEEFVRAFHRSLIGRENRLEIATYWQDHADRRGFVGEHSKQFRSERFKVQTHLISWMGQLSTVALRKYQRLKNGWAWALVRILVSIVQGVLTGLSYWHTPDSSVKFTPGESIFFIAILMIVLSAMEEVLNPSSERFNVSRAYNTRLYRSSTDAIATVVFDLPLSIVSHSAFGAVVYVLVGFRVDATGFAVFLLFIVSLASTMKTFFRSLASLVPNKEAMHAFAGSFIVLLLLYSELADSNSSAHRALQWLSWINPLRYALAGLITNESLDREISCSSLVPHGDGDDRIFSSTQTCLAAVSMARQASNNSDPFHMPTQSIPWINLSFILAFGVISFGFFVSFSEWNKQVLTSFVLYKPGSQERVTDQLDAYRHIRRLREASNNDDHGAQYEVPLKDVFAWKNLQYVLPRQKRQKEFFRDGISGYVAPRKMCAVIGGSGVGKTMLLSVLSGRAQDGILTGDLHLDGLSIPLGFQSQIGYCQQTELHHSRQTVREALRFSADLRLPTTVSRQEKDEYIESCLKMCGLEAYEDAMVHTLDIEYQKRTSIGIELAAQPKLLFFLDEPTNGLDSQAALAVVALLRDLANCGQAILCAMNQPSSEILQHFDQALVLHKGGKMVYFGDIGPEFSTMINYFESNGARPCDPTENPAEWIMNIVSADDNAYIPVNWHHQWLRSPEVARLRGEIDEFQRKCQTNTVSAVECSRPERITSWFHQTNVLLRRSRVAYWRSPGYLIPKLLFNIISGLFIGMTLFGYDDSLQGTRSKVLAAFILTVICIPLASQLQIRFMDVRRVYEGRERYSHMYSWTAFLVSHLLVELMWNVLSSVLLISAWYWVAGFDPSRFASSLLMIGFLYPLYYTALALCLASISPSAGVASLLFYVVSSFSWLSDGVIHPFNPHGWWKWMHRASPFAYLLEGFISQALGGQKITCSPSEFSILLPSAGQTCTTYLADLISNSGGYANNPDDTEFCEYCPARTTDEFLASRYNMYSARHWRNISVLLAVCASNVLMLFFLTYIFRIRRWHPFCFFGRRKAL